MSDHNPLIKQVQGQLFSFEEKIFGIITLTQLLSSLAAAVGILYVTSALRGPTRIVVASLLAVLSIVLIYSRVNGQPLLSFLALYARFFLAVKKHSTYQEEYPASKTGAATQNWITLNRLERGIASDGGQRYWAVLECSGRNVRLLEEEQQIKHFSRFEDFLCGLAFRLQFTSLVEPVDPAHFEPLQVQQKALDNLPSRLATLQKESIDHQHKTLLYCTRVRHFVVISCSAKEEGDQPRTLSALRPKPQDSTREHTIDQLRTRIALVQKTLRDLDIPSRLLDETHLLSSFAMCLGRGTQVNSFNKSDTMSRSEVSPASLLAPSVVDITPDTVMIETHGKKRYLRYFWVQDFGHQLLCGWTAELTELGGPLIISKTFEGFPNQFMINRMEMQLVRLESRRLADEKAIRIGKTLHATEADQIRPAVRALAENRSKIYAMQMIIGLSASSPERLEQRTRQLQAFLHSKQLKARSATLAQDKVWQATLPVCPPLSLDTCVHLPSDVVSTFLDMSDGTIGTPTGVFLGWTSTGQSRRPVFFNPWNEERRIPNPHVVVVGESGMGKSFLGKVITTGLMGCRIADVVVLDRDDDYLPLHQFLGEESQRYNLARGCPMNFFDLPYAPSDVDADERGDLLSEFIDNQLLTGLALLLCEPDTRLSKIEEAYLMHVARLCYQAAGVTSEAICSQPETLLLPMPTLGDFIETMKQTPASSLSLRDSLIERLEKASYLFSGQTSVSIEKPLTIFSIRELDEKWYALMTFVVQNFLMRHRALREFERYLAYVVEEASYMLKHPAGRKYLETGSRGFRKLGIAQITLSQHPREFLTDGAVIMNNCGTACFLGMQQYAARELHLPDALERTLTHASPGQMVMRVGNEYAEVEVATSSLHKRIFTTTPQERRKLRTRHMKEKVHHD